MGRYQARGNQVQKKPCLVPGWKKTGTDKTMFEVPGREKPGSDKTTFEVQGLSETEFRACQVEVLGKKAQQAMQTDPNAQKKSSQK